MVTGGNKNDRWWCWLYSWIIAIFVIIYCIFVVIIALTSLFTYNNAISKVDMSEQNNKMTPENSNNYAKMMIETNTKDAIERFTNDLENKEEEIKDVSTDFIQSFTNSSNISPPSSNPTEMITTSVPATPPSTSSPSSSVQTPTPPSKDTFSSTEMIDEEPEPFSNRNYASFR
jgi:hypothetical protein